MSDPAESTSGANRADDGPAAGRVVVYTDGACSGNPGPGGWGWITTDGREGSGGEAETTNQRMELMAVLEALRALPGPLEVRSDSTYVVNCFRDKWYEGWIARGWRTSAKKPVANQDLWQPLIEEYQRRPDRVLFTWVKGHSGDAFNDAADGLAVAAAAAYRPEAAKNAAPESVATDCVASNVAGNVAGVEAPWPVGRAVWAVGATELDDDGRDALVGAVDGLDPRADVLVSGLRRGVELEAAERARRNGVPLGVVLPFDDPARGWPTTARQRFDAVLASARWTVVLPGDPNRPSAAIAARNRWMADKAIGAIVLGDAALAAELDEAGVSVIA